MTWAGMHGMGPIHYEKDEPVFHEPWEGRVYAMSRAMGAWRRWTLDHCRHGIELLPQDEYLRMSYYERWFTLLGHRAPWARDRHRGRSARRAMRPQGRRAPRRRWTVRAARTPEPQNPVRDGARRQAAVPSPATRAHAELQSPRTHAAAALRARETGRRSCAITASTTFRTRWRTTSATNASTSTPCASRRASCGAKPRRRAIRPSRYVGGLP